jgi:hypothetical protein
MNFLIPWRMSDYACSWLGDVFEIKFYFSLLYFWAYV